MAGSAGTTMSGASPGPLTPPPAPGFACRTADTVRRRGRTPTVSRPGGCPPSSPGTSAAGVPTPAGPEPPAGRSLGRRSCRRASSGRNRAGNTPRSPRSSRGRPDNADREERPPVPAPGRCRPGGRPRRDPSRRGADPDPTPAVILGSSVDRRSSTTGTRSPRTVPVPVPSSTRTTSPRSGHERERSTRQDPSIRRWVCNVRPESNRVKRCFPQVTFAVTVIPTRSAVACAGTRSSARSSGRPSSAASSRLAAR